MQGRPEAANVDAAPYAVETHFSWLRTRLSVERTLMSWIRTGTALIGLGFTIFQFFERLNAVEGSLPTSTKGRPAIYAAVLLILVGMSAFLAVWLRTTWCRSSGMGLWSN